ncbi:MAG TPA: LacI family DNA-binding transcriptional regulator [Devosiaceae bacterium]
MVDIARAAGVSKSTVSLVLQGSPLVHESTRAKVQAAIRDLGYVYNRGAANLRRSRSSVVGMIINDLTNSFFAELAVGIDRTMQASGHVPFLANTAESTDRQAEVIASMLEHGIAGLIISPARGTEPRDLKPVIDSGIPVVLVVRGLPHNKASSVQPDNRAGAREAVRHLVALGHRRIAFLGGYGDADNFHDRLAGYRDALADASIAVEQELIVPTAPSRAGGIAAANTLLDRADPPRAALCFNDAVAFGACDALRGHGIEPGIDFGIVGFDDVIEAKSVRPALTTVSVAPQALGERAAQLLLKQINSGRHEVENILTPVRLAVRESCGAAAARAKQGAIA